MNLLTKEECEKSLKIFYEIADKFVLNNYLFMGSYIALKVLIQEHFENPPLEFEELQEEMWIWDNQLKWFFKVVICNVKVEGYESLKMFKVEKYEGGSTLMIYEPNRFYRKEVQE